MHHKATHLIEGLFFFLWTVPMQTAFSITASAVIILYYAGQIKYGTVDKQFGGSWLKFIKNLFK